MRFAVQAALLQIFLSAEGCSCIAGGLGRFTFWLRSMRFLRGLRGIFAVVEPQRTAAWTT